ncbi:hypothetical protein MMC25_001763 [Agyrium rufum]|nr:hypothetical protein [Agyrium rufum]
MGPKGLHHPHTDLSHSQAIHFLAGLSTGTLSAALLQPIDLVKTRLQQSHSQSLLFTLRSISSGPHPVSQLWRGTLPTILRSGFGSAMYFTMLNSMRQSAARWQASRDASASTTISLPSDGKAGPASVSSSSSALPHLSAKVNLLTGALARVTAGFILMPLTVLKVRYESDLYAYSSLRQACGSIYAKEGRGGFFAGFVPTAVRDAPYAGLYVVFYEWGKGELGRVFGGGSSGSSSSASSSSLLRNPADRGAGGDMTRGQDGRDSGGRMKSTVSVPINFAAGVLAAGLATLVTNPFDAVKTRVQLEPKRYGNMVMAVRMMVKEEGWRSLMDGAALRMGRKAASSALVWTVYEEAIRWAERGVGDAAKAGL